MSSQLAGLQHHSTADYDSDEEIDNSRYQIAFNDTMERYNLNNPLTYQKVEVLLLQWASESSDLSTGLDDEVHRLKALLEQKFHYHAVIEYLDVKSHATLQAQVNVIISQFVHRHHDPETLLIVYYAGHGKPGGNFYGELRLFGKVSPNMPCIANSSTDRDKAFNQVVWNQAEILLRATHCNVLEIFDWLVHGLSDLEKVTDMWQSCYAGTACLTRGEPNFFEFLAATGATGTTARPGPKSFTSALIYALEELLKSRPGGRFTTAELLWEIKHRAPNFPEDQRPVLSDRQDDNVPGRIVLHPLKKGHRTGQIVRERLKNAVEHEEKSEKPISPAVEQLNRRVLTMHFDYVQEPSIEQVEALTGPIMDIIQRNRLGVGIRFGGVQRTTTGRAIRRLTKSSRRRQSARQETFSPDSPTSHKMSPSLGTSQTHSSSLSSASQASLNFKDFVEKPYRSPITPNTEISDLLETGSVEDHESLAPPNKKRKWPTEAREASSRSLPMAGSNFAAIGSSKRSC